MHIQTIPRGRKRWFASIAGCCGLIFSGAAHAQTTDAPPVVQLGQTLAAKGIYLNANYFGEFATNPSGGVKQGSAYADQAAFGADADLQKLVGWQGGTLHLELTNRDGRDLANDTINNSVAAQQIYGGGQTYNLTTLTLEQKLLNGMLDITAGRTELDQLTLNDPIYCHFQSNAFCGQPDIMGKIINASFWPVSVWAGKVVISPVRDWSLEIGVADHDPKDSASPHHGFDFSTTNSNGVEIPIELDYKTSFADDNYPRRYDVGAVFDRTAYSYAQYDAKTNTLGSGNGYGRTMVYVQAKQMVYRPDMNSDRGLTVFGAAVFGPDAHQSADYNLTAGAVYQGPLASRPADSLGIAVGDLHYRSNFIDQLYAYRTNTLGGSGRPASNLIMAEIDYDAYLTPYLDVMPNLQYIVHPDGLGAQAYPGHNLNDAFVVGLQFNLNVGKFIGLPSED
ncbi:porin [Acidocella aquatica]|uniref:Porin n=1 Tax=Acidocella aquatica TaxID=1922313 RepID=A0ABQ6A8N8_9PROT|nr:carbohydrate porin [Acidocella aquatica]GLR68859.1 porin [Acidocella aquatica]